MRASTNERIGSLVKSNSSVPKQISKEQKSTEFNSCVAWLYINTKPYSSAALRRYGNTIEISIGLSLNSFLIPWGPKLAKTSILISSDPCCLNFSKSESQRLKEIIGSARSIVSQSWTNGRLAQPNAGVKSSELDPPDEAQRWQTFCAWPSLLGPSTLIQPSKGFGHVSTYPMVCWDWRMYVGCRYSQPISCSASTHSEDRREGWEERTLTKQKVISNLGSEGTSVHKCMRRIKEGRSLLFNMVFAHHPFP